MNDILSLDLDFLILEPKPSTLGLLTEIVIICCNEWPAWNNETIMVY